MLTKPLNSQRVPISAATDAPLLSTEEIVLLIEQADALRNSRAHDHEVLLRHPGDARSAHLGRGLDFEEVRAYQAGDDIRAMDWRTTARTGEPYMKVYREEHHPALHVIVDRGASMRFGTQHQLKVTQAARVAILAAVLESSAHACVGGTIMDSPPIALPCFAKQAGILQLAKASAAPCPPLPHPVETNTHWLDVLRHIAVSLLSGSRLLLLSDFHWLRPEDAPLLAHLALHHDVAAIHISDPVEHELPALGRMQFYDLAQQGSRWIDTNNRRVREHFSTAAAQQQKSIAGLLAQLDIDYFPLSTNAAAMDLFLGQRDD